MYSKKEDIVLNFKIGVIKELYKRQLITQKQMEDTIALFNLEYRKQNLREGQSV